MAAGLVGARGGRPPDRHRRARRRAADRPRHAAVRLPRASIDQPQGHGREGAAVSARRRPAARTTTASTSRTTAVDGNLVLASRPRRGPAADRLPDAHHVIGWSYCELAPVPPRRSAAPRRLRADPSRPAPTTTRWPTTTATANADAYTELLKGPWRLTVRAPRDARAERPVAGRRRELRPRPARQLAVEIDAADAVVAADGTFPSLAIARGVPTVIYGQPEPPHVRPAGRAAAPAPAHRPLRWTYIRYPFDVEDGPLDEVLHAAARSEAPIADWKRRFVGAPLDDVALRGAARAPHVRLSRDAVDVDATGASPSSASPTRCSSGRELARRLRAPASGRRGRRHAHPLGPRLDDGALLAMVQTAVAAAGVDDDRLPDVLLLPCPGRPAVDQALAERAQAVLSEWPPAGRIGPASARATRPRFGRRGIRRAQAPRRPSRLAILAAVRWI